MKTNIIKNFQNSTAKLIADGDLHDAFAAMRTFSEGSMTWEITSNIDRLEQNYAMMLRYMADGVDDPGRQAVYDDIAAEARAIVDALTRRAMMAEAPTLYYGTARNAASHSGATVASLAQKYRAELRRLDLDFESIAEPRRTVTAETLLRELFEQLWTEHPLRPDDIAAAKDLILSDSMPEHARALATSAIALGVMEFYDPKRLVLLLETYLASDSDEVALRALVGFFIAMFRYRRRPISRTLANAIAAAKDSPRWHSDLKNAAIELLRARDTERISAKLTEEILPSLSKIMPEVNDRLRSGDFTPENLLEGGNPEWDDMFNKSGLGDKLREMSELQAEGGDVYMSSFSRLKQFPFFNYVSNWFLPFYAGQSDVAAADEFDGSLGDLLAGMPFLCDSDKYSALLSLGTVPGSQREALSQALGAQNQQMRQMLSEVEKADSATRRKTIINNYVRDLYRFHQLFRRKGEFFNVFAHEVNLLEIPVLADGFDDTETLGLIAEFCIRHGFWREGCSLLKKADEIAEPDSLRSQKIAFCLERMGQYAEAISYYDMAEMLGGSGEWLLGRMARTLRRLGKPTRAVECFKRLLELTPDDVAVVIELGHTYLEANNTAEAEKAYYQAFYLAPDNATARRGLAWSLFLNGKYEAAAKIYDDLLASGTPVAEDLLNAGHTARARGEMRNAIAYYGRFVAAEGRGVKALEDAFASDNRWLVDANIDTRQNKLLLEAIRYTIN